MTKNLTLSLMCSLAMFGSACAQEAPSAKDITDKAVDVTTNAISDVKTEVVQAVETTKPVLPAFTAPDSAWRSPDPENTIYIDTVHGRVVVELYPEIAPNHVDRIKTLAREGFYNGVKFHRVIEGFMNQTGDPRGDGTGSSSYPDLKQEFAFSRDGSKMPVSMNGDMKSKLDGAIAVTGFYKALPIATPTNEAMAAKKEVADSGWLTKKGVSKPDSYGLHCPGVTSMARGGHSVDSANSQFFLMRAESRFLDADYTIWGATIHGHDVLKKIKIGTINDPKFPGFVPDTMLKVQVAADAPASDRMNVEVLRTDTPNFDNYTNWLMKKNGRRATICQIQIPSRLK